jgi:proline dehydrogenase
MPSARNMLSRTLILKVSHWSFIEKLVRRSFLFRPMVKRFIGGDTLEDGLRACEPLLDRGFMISLDLLGENVSTKEESERAKATFIEMLHRLAKHPRFKAAAYESDGKTIAEPDTINISIKLTQCGFDISDDYAEANYREVLDVAKGYGCLVRADMEGSPYTERTIAILERVLPDYPNAGTVLQSYLFRTPADLTRLIPIKCRLRLVKGAYLEPASIAYPEKAKVDEAYIDLAKRMLCEGNYPAFATHDEKIIDIIKRFAADRKIAPATFEFQMLYGIRRDLQDKLLNEGYRVRVYVPFGSEWYPYFTRRLAERPANLWFILRSMFKG